MPSWVLLLALLLRLPLMTDSLWLDEAIQAMALKGAYGPLMTYALGDFQPPLYHFLLWGWTRIAGFSELALRTPSLLAGLGTVYFLYHLGDLLSGRRTALTASILAATNPLLIYYSAEGRTYMLTCFLVTASFYYLFRMLKDSNLNHSALYLLFTTAALWTSYLAWIVIALQFGYLLVIRRVRLAGLPLFAAVTLLPWMPSLFSSLGIGLSTVADSPEWGSVVGGLSAKALALTWVKAAIGRISFSPPVLYAGVVLGVSFLHLSVLRRLKRPSPLLLVWLLVIPLAAAVSYFIPVYSYFRLLFAVPAYLLLLAIGGMRAPRLTGAVILTQLVFVGIYYTSPRFHHEDWRGLTAFLNEQEGVVAMPSLSQAAPLDYYRLRLPRTELKQGETIQETPAPTVYYLRYVEDVFDPAMAGRANLRTLEYTKVNEHTWPGLAVEVYEQHN